ncbi:MAG: UDP-N-acetylglucosamine--N-acetylmuramyl-(pentapeptide) pyrophosphoryl-undecaprenol N-acetylglucosamine transferase [Ilumatobacteraceae bacterium]
MVYAVVTGGGTSGHVIPALAICELLVEAGHSPDDIRYVGSRRGIETQLMVDTAIASEFLPISGLQRSWTIRGMARNALLPWRLLHSRFLARGLIKLWKPSVVISVGGYASEPISRAAIQQDIPLVCVSYDRIAGLATRRQARHATICAVSFENSSLPNSVMTGAPVRRHLRTLHVADSRAISREMLGLSSTAQMVVVMGGSLGSGVLNAMVADLLRALEGREAIVYHICGERFVRDPMPHVPAGVQYIRVGYEDRMADVYSALDVLVSRAGASSVAEIATVGVAAVLVPWPDAAENHQELNARWLTDSGAGILMDDAACADGRAVVQITQLLADRDRVSVMARTAYQLGTMHRSSALVDAIEGAAHATVARGTMDD